VARGDKRKQTIRSEKLLSRQSKIPRDYSNLKSDPCTKAERGRAYCYVGENFEGIESLLLCACPSPAPQWVLPKVKPNQTCISLKKCEKRLNRSDGALCCGLRTCDVITRPERVIVKWFAHWTLFFLGIFPSSIATVSSLAIAILSSIFTNSVAPCRSLIEK